MHDKQSLLQALDATHQKIIGLVNTLNEEQLAIPFHPGVNPPVWEIGHSAFFYEVFILQALDKVASVDPSLDDIWDSFQIHHRDRWKPGMIPSREDTLEYVNLIHQRVRERIENKPLTPEELYLNKYAIYHQNMHIESLVWARQTVGYNKPDGNGKARPDSTENAPLGDAEVPGGRYRVGMPGESPDFALNDFAFDAEKPGFEVEVDDFRISKTLVSNQEYVEFIEDGGYKDVALWSWGGRKWLQTKTNFAVPPAEDMRLPQHPQYWRNQDGQWQERHFGHWQPLIDNYPVLHISYWEAEAFCNWAKRRLPTEYEWEVAALANKKGQPHRRFPWGNEMDASKVDMDAQHLAQIPVTAYPQGDSPFGCRQMLGTAWEWTSSQFLPYDGFKVDMYPFMSTLQFGYHKTTKGGSCATSSILIRGTYRQAYLPERTDAFVGFRTCALDS